MESQDAANEEAKLTIVTRKRAAERALEQLQNKRPSSGASLSPAFRVIMTNTLVRPLIMTMRFRLDQVLNLLILVDQQILITPYHQLIVLLYQKTLMSCPLHQLSKAELY